MKLMLKAKMIMDDFRSNAKRVLVNEDGDQITGWLIVILLVVVVGAVFLNTYQTTILELWNGIINKAKSTFGI